MFEKLILNPYVKNALKQYMDKGQKNCSAFNSVRPSGVLESGPVQISWHTFSWTSDLISHSIPAQIFFCLDCDQASIKFV